MRTCLLSVVLCVSCGPAPAPVAVDLAPAESPAPRPSVEPSEARLSFEAAPPESPRQPAPPGAATAATPARVTAITLDRPLYRPGETVWARIWDVGEGTDAGSDDVRVTLNDGRGTVLLAQQYRNMGAGAAVALDLPPGLAGGRYTLTARVGDRSEHRPLLVAAFEEPRLRKELELLRDAYGPGDEVMASLKLASSGGGPLADHEVKVVVQVEGRALPVVLARTDGHGEALLRFYLPEELRRPDAVLAVIVEEEGWTESITKEIPVVLDQIQLEWFPEGGELVEGLPSRVYLRARDLHGEAADTAGVITDDRGQEVATFRTLHDGLARFELTPQRGRTYHARLTEPASASASASSRPVPLPIAKRDGCSLRAYDDLEGQEEALRVGVWCSTARPVVLAGSFEGAPLVPASVSAGPSEPAVVHLRSEDPARDKRQGVARVTLLSSELEPIAERLVYRRRHRDLQLSIVPARADYGPRDEVVLQVQAKDPDGKPVAADLALSVVDDRLLKLADDQHGDLRSQLHLGPYVQGLEDPAWYFDPAQPDAGLGLDLVMGTFGWRRFVRPQANPDAGEGARARDSGNLQQQIGSLHILDEERAVLLGAAGLGARGTGLGGGGTAEGLGGLGTKGMGSGASGYGSGGGTFGARGEGEAALALRPEGAKGRGGLGTVGGDPIILGALDRSLIDEVVKRHINQIRYCYQRELNKAPTLGGKVVIKFTIAKDGTVSQASTKSTTMSNSAVENCMLGRFLRMQFPEPKGGGIVIVSYPFLFSPGDGVPWVPPPRAAPAYTAERQYAQPDYRDQPAPGVRTDFRSTVAWQGRVSTEEDGTAEVRFSLDDSVTTFRITAEGVGQGLVGHEEVELHSTRPFSLDVPLPLEVSFGDRLLVPIRLSNRRQAPLQVDLETIVAAPLVPEDGTGRQQLRLLGGAGGVTVVPVQVPDMIGQAEILVSASSEALTDRVSRRLSIVPRGFPTRWSRGGELAQRAVEEVVIEDALPGGTEARLTLYTTPLAGLLEGVESMVAMPHGCFEQTSSTNHPNVLILRHLQETGRGASLAAERSEVLRQGYHKLAGYQVEGGGFETFGRGPGKEALSAYGLLQFTQMRQVFPDVSDPMVERDVAWLLGARDGGGGYQQGGTSSHRYGAAPPEVNDAYITYALVETGRLQSGPEIERQRQLAQGSSDPYLLALAALTLRHTHPDEGQRAVARLAALQAADGSFPGAGTSISVSGGRDLLVETTALAALALHRSEDHREGAVRAARYLGQARQGSWGWGGTQATVLALEALSVISQGTGVSPGRVEVHVDGVLVGTVQYTGEERRGATLDLSPWLGPGSHTITLSREGSGPALPYTVEATWRREQPRDAAGAPLALETQLSSAAVSQGESVRLLATVHNTSTKGVASPIARLGLPAGVRAETWQLEALRDQGKISFFETRPREVTLYWEEMGPGAQHEVALDLVAEIPGTFSAPPSQVHPYYDTDARSWAAGGTLTIRP
jgi:hypothetical protein